MENRTLETPNSFARWIRTVLATPIVTTDGDYFDRLNRTSAMSAPVRSQCSP